MKVDSIRSHQGQKLIKLKYFFSYFNLNVFGLQNRRDHHKNRYIHDSFGPKYLTYGETKTLQSPLSTSSSSHGLASPSLSSHASSFQSKNVSSYYSTKEKRKEGGHGGGPLEKQTKFECFGIYLILISLAFTVFWGKLFGIILTSTLLYFFAVWDSSSPCQKRFPSCPRLRQSLQGKDTRNYHMLRNYYMTMVPINLHVTHNRDLHFIRKS